jgi:hypothetical protein
MIYARGVAKYLATASSLAMIRLALMHYSGSNALTAASPKISIKPASSF